LLFGVAHSESMKKRFSEWRLMASPRCAPSFFLPVQEEMLYLAIEVNSKQ
jgi:hypothetical protein